MLQDHDAYTGYTNHQEPEAHDLMNSADRRAMGTQVQAMSGLGSAPTQVHPATTAATSSLPPPSSLLDASNVSAPLQPIVGNTGYASASASAPPVCVTALAPDPSYVPADASNEGDKQSQVAPQTPIVPPGPHQPSIRQTATTKLEGEVQSAAQSQELQTSDHDLLPALHHILDGPAQSINAAPGDKMIFGHQNAAQAAQRRRNMANTNALTEYEADMTSRDRAKQKEAVKRYLTERVKQDWTWEWPRPEGFSSEAPPEPSPIVDRVYTGEERWKERDEWISNASDDEDPVGIPTSVSSPDTPSTRHSPYRFESPDGVGDTVKKTQWERKQRRRKRLAEEMAWNVGLQCFVSRRDAWTGARKVSRPTLGLVPVKTAQQSSVSSGDGGSSTAIEKEEDEEWEDDIEIPIAPPILPPENQMRASILPGSYNTIYDKVVVQSLQPSCPMNLKDVTRSCVQGWKRDGEWPPKSSVPEPKKKGRKMSVASLFGLDKHEKEEQLKEHDKEKETTEKKPSTTSGIRKSIQKILSLGHNAHKDKESTSTNGNGKLAKGSAGSPITGA